VVVSGTASVVSGEGAEVGDESSSLPLHPAMITVAAINAATTRLDWLLCTWISCSTMIETY
jgi:hypothetical protein